MSHQMPENEIVLIGIGEIGSVLAKGFLKQGFSAHPATCESGSQRLAGLIEQPAPVVIAAGENG